MHLVVYHLVCCPRRRKRVLVGRVAADCDRIIREVCAERGWETVRLAVELDHVHLFVGADPSTAAHAIARAVKGHTSHVLRDTHRGRVRLRLHRPLSGEPKTLVVIRKADGWYAHVTCEIAPAPAGVEGRPSARGALDMGVEALYTLHTGQRPEPSGALVRAHRTVKAEQRALSCKTRGSNRRARQRERLAKAQLKLARVRRDHLHKLTRQLADQYTAIAVEDLTVTAMVRSARGTIEVPGTRVRQKAGLNRGIHNQAWSEFVELLDYKLAEHGGQVVNVDPRGTSQECSGCGSKVPKPLSARWHQCPACGLSLHRDHNAAINIYQRAWAASAAEAA